MNTFFTACSPFDNHTWHLLLTISIPQKLVFSAGAHFLCTHQKAFTGHAKL
jgi:hypothetical protein